jgi:hypothetical protein
VSEYIKLLNGKKVHMDEFHNWTLIQQRWAVDKAFVKRMEQRDHTGVNKGAIRTEEHRLKISLTLKGAGPNKGKHLSAKTKAKISLANLGSKRTKESKAKMSEAHKRRTEYATSSISKGLANSPKFQAYIKRLKAAAAARRRVKVKK